MLNFSVEEINNAFEKTGPRIQEVLNSSWLVDDIEMLGRGIKMTIGQITELTKLISYVLLDLIPLTKFIEHTENELEISHERATEIAEKVDQAIFARIRKNITEKESQKKENKEEQEIIDNPEALRDSLLKDIEAHAEESEGGEQNNSDNLNVLKEVVSNDLEERKVDPYREET